MAPLELLRPLQKIIIAMLLSALAAAFLLLAGVFGKEALSSDTKATPTWTKIKPTLQDYLKWSMSIQNIRVYERSPLTDAKLTEKKRSMEDNSVCLRVCTFCRHRLSLKTSSLCAGQCIQGGGYDFNACYTVYMLRSKYG
ncbi:hypothetical protein CAPTEDRAFT_213294 [Capitella teleta]|uniref:Uncharacterized protein n=1 Tax=Capitella teleta TaxID=283909 RepID=R7UY72_CAPTE|nr:hypothetical protein CAPTEDRAFT_213294 [Capitella teleta]|eukprot:ELU08386.1 hypothetical protein CAPTEDRAFT_213294 [Capitella teleta]